MSKDNGWPEENAFRLSETAGDFLLDAPRCLLRLTERPPVVGRCTPAQVPRAVLVFSLKVPLHFEAQDATAWDEDNEVRLAFNLAYMLCDVQGMQYDPVGGAPAEFVE